MNFELENVLQKHQRDYHPVVPFTVSSNKIAALNLSKHNKEISPEIYKTTQTLASYIDYKQKQAGATYLIGGYKEQRDMYRRSPLFDTNLQNSVVLAEEPRSIHLGIDIWGPAGTTVFAPLGGMVHSFANNANHGDYGATIILQHQLDTVNFYTLYGHLSLRDVMQVDIGKFLTRGQPFAHFGTPEENGDWPPHLHFQVITDMLQFEGDFPGVCKPGEAGRYFGICPDPDYILNLNKYIGKD